MFRLGLALLQAQGYCGRPMKYVGMWDVLQQTVRKEGVRGLYKAKALPPLFAQWWPLLTQSMPAQRGVFMLRIACSAQKGLLQVSAAA